MYYNYITATCSNCKKTLYIKITKLMWFIRVTSGLGPNSIVCSSCNTKMMTSFKEWKQMSFAGKLWYVILSVLYGLLLGFMTSTLVGVAVDKLFAYSLSTDLAALVIVAPITLIILVVQVERILHSIDRTENRTETEKTVNFWDWETNLQFYGMMWLLLVVAGSVPFLMMK